MNEINYDPFQSQSIEVQDRNNSQDLIDAEKKSPLNQMVNNFFSTLETTHDVLEALGVKTQSGVQFLISQVGELYGSNDPNKWANVTDAAKQEALGFYKTLATVSKSFLHKYVSSSDHTSKPSDSTQVSSKPTKKIVSTPLKKKPKAAHLHPRGIFNGGNNCWINSIMQTLHLSDSLKEKILQQGLGLENDHPLMKYGSLNGPSLRKAYNQLVFERKIPYDFQQGQQADVLEALSLLVGKIKGENPLNFQITVETGITTYDRNPYNRRDAKVTNVAFETKEETENMLNLSLSSSSNSNPELKDLFTSYLREELDPHEEEFGFRNNPNMRRTAIERKFKTNPDQLLISLKKFEFNPNSAVENKITKGINVPLKLDLKDFSNEEQPFDLELKSFIVHLGNTTNVGHYVNCTKVGNQWYYISDNEVHTLTKTQAKEMANQAYIVYYEKKKE